LRGSFLKDFSSSNQPYFLLKSFSLAFFLFIFVFSRPLEPSFSNNSTTYKMLDSLGETMGGTVLEGKKRCKRLGFDFFRRRQTC